MSVEDNLVTITVQPKHSGGGENIQSAVDGRIPLGLKQLTNLDEIRVSQHLDAVEVCLGWSRPSRYSIYAGGDGELEQFLYIEEISECFARQCLGASRDFTLNFSDVDQEDVMAVRRPLVCARGCCGVCCCLPVLRIETPPGKTVATMREIRTCCNPTYHIYDGNERLKYTIRTSCCYISLCSDIHVKVYDVESDMAVAELRKKTKCNGKECTGAQNNFSLKFLEALTMRDKVIVLGSMFLVDFHYFEGHRRCIWC